MNDERVAQALRVLREEGLEVKLQPDVVFIHVGKLEIACPHSPGAGNHRNTRVVLDGREFQNFLSAISLRLAVNEVNTATIELGIFP